MTWAFCVCINQVALLYLHLQSRSVKIVGTLCCLLALSMLVCKIWETAINNIGRTRRWTRSTGQFQKISIPNRRRLPCFNPPLPSEIPKCVTPPYPQNSIIVNPSSPSEFPFFWKYIFDIAMPIWTNEYEFMPLQGCDLASPGDKLYSSATRKTYH